jgi:hypothetical protein
MKKILSYILIVVTLAWVPLAFVSAADCNPTFSGNYTVEANCTWPAGGVKVFGNMTVGTRTVTVPNGRVVGVNLGTNTVTFSTGKMLFTGSAKMDNSVSKRHYEAKSYTSWSNVTNCASWWKVLNQIAPTVPTAYQWWSRTGKSTSGSIYCGK